MCGCVVRVVILAKVACFGAVLHFLRSRVEGVGAEAISCPSGTPEIYRDSMYCDEIRTTAYAEFASTAEEQDEEEPEAKFAF